MVNAYGQHIPDYPGQQPYMDSQYMQYMRNLYQNAQQGAPQATQPAQYQQQAAPQVQMMTPPTIHAEIVQVESLNAAEQYPVAAGGTVMMQLKDDSAFVVKAATPNGPIVDVYLKQKRTEPKTAYITHEELEARLAPILAAIDGNASRGRKKAKESDHEPVRAEATAAGTTGYEAGTAERE